MKKFLIAILAFLYIISFIGATVYMHYCMGKLASDGLVNHTSKACNKCGMKKTGQENKDCCKNESKFLKSQQNFNVTLDLYHLRQSVAAALSVSYLIIPSVGIFILREENSIILSPSQSSDVALYIRNCVFLI